MVARSLCVKPTSALRSGRLCGAAPRGSRVASPYLAHQGAHARRLIGFFTRNAARVASRGDNLGIATCNKTDKHKQWHCSHGALAPLSAHSFFQTRYEHRITLARHRASGNGARPRACARVNKQTYFGLARSLRALIMARHKRDKRILLFRRAQYNHS